jgi:anti-sigma regulatory factor (Ser/Thr protein kinase)
MVASRMFPAHGSSVGAARRFVRELLSVVPTDQSAAELLVSELATNAVEHGRSAFEVRVDIRSSIVRVAVVNDAPELLVAVTEQPSEAGGFGLNLVEALAPLWGTESTADTKTVWFELPRDRENIVSAAGS